MNSWFMWDLQKKRPRDCRAYESGDRIAKCLRTKSQADSSPYKKHAISKISIVNDIRDIADDFFCWALVRPTCQAQLLGGCEKSAIEV